MDAPLDSAAGGQPNFLATQWKLVVAASAEGFGEAGAALENQEPALSSGQRLEARVPLINGKQLR